MLVDDRGIVVVLYEVVEVGESVVYWSVVDCSWIYRLGVVYVYLFKFIKGLIFVGIIWLLFC